MSHAWPGPAGSRIRPCTAELMSRRAAGYTRPGPPPRPGSAVFPLNLFGYVAFLFPLLAGVAAARIFLNRKHDNPRDARVSALIFAGFVLTVRGAGGLAGRALAQTGELAVRRGGV